MMELEKYKRELDNGNTELMDACELGFHTTVKSLIQTLTPNSVHLSLACNSNNYNITQLLLNYPVTPEKYHIKESIILGNVQIVDLLARYGCDISLDDEFCFRMGCVEENEELVRIAVEYGADVHIYNSYYINMLLKHRKNNLVKVILEHDPDQCEYIYDASVRFENYEISRLVLKLLKY